MAAITAVVVARLLGLFVLFGAASNLLTGRSNEDIGETTIQSLVDSSSSRNALIR